MMFRREERDLKGQKQVTGRPAVFRDTAVVDQDTALVDQGRQNCQPLVLGISGFDFGSNLQSL